MKYRWRAILKDGTELKEERGGGLNEDERKNCKIFSWVDEEIDHKVSVDLTTGIFKIDGQTLLPSRGDVEVLSGRTSPEYRLIYAKRHFFTYGAGPAKDELGLYLIGWQITLDGKNIKRILYIRPSGEIIFGGEGY